MSSSPVTFTNQGAVQSSSGTNKDLRHFHIETTDGNVREAKEVPSFEESLQEGLQKINSLQIKAESSMQDMVTGDVDDISEVAAAVSEADLALRFAVQVRDKLLDAYNQLIRISV